MALKSLLTNYFRILNPQLNQIRNKLLNLLNYRKNSLNRI